LSLARERRTRRAARGPFCHGLISLENLERAVTTETTGIVATHLWGRVCDVDGLKRFARSRGLKVILDAAHAFGVRRRGVAVGNFGDCEVFSFHATKFINAFEGGAVTTNSDEIAERLRSMRNFGFVGLDAVTSVGTNAKMSEVSGAMGLTCIEDMAAIIESNRTRTLAYERTLQGVSGIRLLRPAEDEESNYQYVVALVEPGKFGLTRDELAQALWAEGVLVRRYFHPGCHRMKAYSAGFPGGVEALPVTERLSEEVLVLPTGPNLGLEDAEAIASLILALQDRAPEVRAALRGREDAWTAAHRRSFEMLAEAEPGQPGSVRSARTM
jgi:dTDP-4-amino-4,6-dideoxygalactose transaminase